VVISHTSHISYARSSKDSDQFGRRASIIADGNDIAKRTILALANRIKDIDQIVSSTAAREDNDASICRHRVE
jgi:hypothetical protein